MEDLRDKVRLGDRITLKYNNGEEITTLVTCIDNISSKKYSKVIKIERPVYETVEEIKPVELTAEEKQFIKLLSKITNKLDGNFRIEIERGTYHNQFNVWYGSNIGYVHAINKNYFEALEDKKQYTLEDLGIYEEDKTDE